MKALEKNQMWSIEILPLGKKIIGCSWVFTGEHNIAGFIEWYTTKLVAKRYTQAYNINYEETFAPVTKLNTVRVVLSLAVNLDWPLHQFHVKNAFLHCELTEDVYMDIPPRYTASTQTRMLCKLQKKKKKHFMVWNRYHMHDSEDALWQWEIMGSSISIQIILYSSNIGM